MNWLIGFQVVTALTSGILEFALARCLRGHLHASLLELAGTISIISAVVLLLERSLPASFINGRTWHLRHLCGGVLVLVSLRLRTLGVTFAEESK